MRANVTNAAVIVAVAALLPGMTGQIAAQPLSNVTAADQNILLQAGDREPERIRIADAAQELAERFSAPDESVEAAQLQVDAAAPEERSIMLALADVARPVSDYAVSRESFARLSEAAGEEDVREAAAPVSIEPRKATQARRSSAPVASPGAGGAAKRPPQQVRSAVAKPKQWTARSGLGMATDAQGNPGKAAGIPAEAPPVVTAIRRALRADE